MDITYIDQALCWTPFYGDLLMHDICCEAVDRMRNKQVTQQVYDRFKAVQHSYYVSWQLYTIVGLALGAKEGVKLLNGVKIQELDKVSIIFNIYVHRVRGNLTEMSFRVLMALRVSMMTTNSQ